MLFLLACSGAPEALLAPTPLHESETTRFVSEPLTPQHFSDPAQAVLDVLDEDDRHVTWNISSDSTLESDWLVQTPEEWHWGLYADSFEVDPRCTGAGCHPDFELPVCVTDADCPARTVCTPYEPTVTEPGGTADNLCVNHSEDMVFRTYQTILEADELLDIATLTPPDGRFAAAIRNGLTYLDNDDRDVTVRVLTGSVPGIWTDPDDVVDDLTRDVSWDTTLTVHHAVWRKGLDSWNHAKIVAADGEVVLQGGHNLWTEDYLTQAPVHDVSMVVAGTPAIDAHNFLDAQWDFACEDWWFSGWTDRAVYPSWNDDCPDPFNLDAEEPWTGGARVISIGRLGALGNNPSEQAQRALIASAQESVILSLQDLGPISVLGVSWSDWDQDLVQELALAMIRGVDVTIVLSDSDATAGTHPASIGAYSNGWALEQIGYEIEAWLSANAPHMLPGELLCDKLHLAPMRFGPERSWADDRPIGNHSKLLMVDDAVFYIGSHNLYPADLAEWGLIVDDPAAAQDLKDAYLDPLWTWSSGAAVSGSGRPEECVF